MNQTVKDILTLVVLACVTYDSFGHTVGDRWHDDSRHASATPHMHHDYEPAASIVHAFTQEGDSGIDDLEVGHQISKMQCLTDCHASDYSGIQSQPAEIKLVHHLIEARQMLTEIQHASIDINTISLINDTLTECQSIIKLILTMNTKDTPTDGLVVYRVTHI